MNLWQDGLLALLAAIGLASILWVIAQAVLFAGSERRRGEIVALLPALGDGEGLEEQVKILRSLRNRQAPFGRVMLVDCGLSEEGRRLARLLAREDRWVTLCGQNEVSKFLSG